jgi:hypothetical protein
MARRKAAAPATDRSEMYRATKDEVYLDNGVAVGRPLSGGCRVIVSIRLQGGGENFAHAVLREVDWQLGPGESVMEGDRELAAALDLSYVELKYV